MMLQVRQFVTRREVALRALVLALAWVVAAPGQAQDVGPAHLSPIGDEAYEVMRHFFDYDANVPLDARVVQRLEEGEYDRERVVFTGIRESRVPGYLAIPGNGAAPYPCVLLLHGLSSSKESWWEEHSTMNRLTNRLLESGFAVLTLDAQFHGQRVAANDYAPARVLLEREWFAQATEMVIQSTIEYRRALDYLETRPEIDASRTGVVGYSMGGIMTFILSAIDSRIGVAVSAVSPIITAPYLPTAVHHHAPRIDDTPILMLMATADEQNYSLDQARQLLDLIGGDAKELVFFESGHMLPPEWPDSAADWIVRYLE